MQLVLLAAVVAGAAIRFATLDVQSFWIDEGYTVRMLRGDLGGLIDGVPRTEQTPHLYYVLAWLWTRPFGTGEVGVRSFSALLGVLTIPVVFLLGRRLVSERAGAVAAALTAFCPLLVWYSQEARSYALLVLLAALSMLLFLRARDERPRGLLLWATVSALALATHYFAAFVVVPEAACLLLRARERRAAALAVAGVGAVGVALLPLLIHQQGIQGARFIGGSSLGHRLLQVPKQFLVGYDTPSEVWLTVAAATITVAALVLVLTRTDPSERRGATTAAIAVMAIVGLPLVVAIVGADYFISRNVIAGWLPFAVVLAAGLGARRAPLLGPVLAAGLCAVFLTAVIEVEANAEFQRDDWRGAARALGPAEVRRALVVHPLNGLVPLSVYTRGLERFPGGAVPLSEIDLLAVADRRAGQSPRPPRPPTPRVFGFKQVLRVDSPTFTLIRLRANRLVPFSLFRLTGLKLGDGPSDVLIQRPGG
ncbi:MAG: mannosyltransferase [Thermoleophilaceae bacterium]|nr:mannosyltransferase [Thermoleophilaceae bacterium]